MLIKLLADGLIAPVVLLAVYALLFYVPNSRKYEAYSRIVVVGLTAFLFAKLLGAAFQPEIMRPFELMGLSAGASFIDNPGFPSDHVLFTSYLTMAVWFETRRRGLVVLLATLTLLIGVGRILALVHTPLDVLGGFIVAASSSLWYLQPQSKITKPTSRQKHKQLLQ
jgi:membrane-associated phospholipid phosphatase